MAHDEQSSIILQAQPEAAVPPIPDQQQYSLEQLADPALCVSQERGRSFWGTRSYTAEKLLDAAFEAAKQSLPEAKSAYKPSGKTTASATLFMLAASPFVFLLLLALCGGLCYGLMKFLPDDATNYSDRKAMGFFSLIVNVILVVLMVWVPSACFGFLSKVFKNRKPGLPAILTAVMDFILAIILFLPIWGGATLAPTDLTLIFIPIRWVLILVGGFLVPLVAAFAVYGKVAEQKFCEETGRYLKPLAECQLRFDFLENAAALLQQGEFVRAWQLPPADAAEIKDRHLGKLVLWGHPQATTAFLEMTAHFRGRSKPQKTLTTEESKDKSKDWLIFSAQLDKSQVIAFLQQVAAKGDAT